MPPAFQRLCVLIFFSLVLMACASGRAGDAEPTRVGMHIDALLEFAIEYPLDWEKKRLLYRADDRGEIIWRVPGQEDVNLSVVSEPRREDSDEEPLPKELQELHGFNITHREHVTLPGGKALHVLGYTSRLNYDLLKFDASRRTFTILFSAPPEKISDYDEIRTEIFRSFIPLEPPDASSRTDR